ncbi:MAG: hypothetical protein ACP5H2_10775 [Solirubrobacteraceae bacterium]
MNDDWRIQVTCADWAGARRLANLLGEGDFQHELGDGAGERMIVSADGTEMFVYVGERERALQAMELIGRVAQGAEIVTTSMVLRRWHPVAEAWVDPDAPLPAGGEAAAAEHAALIAREREETRELKVAEWEVRVQCPSHHDVVALAAMLRDEGIPSVRRWRYLLVGAADEDAAGVLAQRISQEVPAGGTVTVEASAAAVSAEMPVSPFAVFGGLGG